MAAVAAAAPNGAVADQASQPSSPAAGHLSTGDFHSCAVLAGGLRCWGYGGHGALGLGDTRSIGDDETPDSVGTVPLGTVRTVTATSAGSVHTCALLDNGTVRCWGFGRDGRLGYGNETTIGDDEAALTGGAIDLGTASGVPLTATAIAAGNGHSCAILVNGELRCWGFNLDGRLGQYNTNPIGDNETPGSIAPIDLGPGRTTKAIAGGAFHNCAILDDDSVRCWGFGGDGRLGYAKSGYAFQGTIGREPPRSGTLNAPTNEERPVDSILTAGPVFLGEANGVPLTARAITAGLGHSCAVLSNGSVRCWGFNGSGQLGYGNPFSVGDDETPGMVTPVDLGPGRTAVAVDAGRDHTCAILDNGALRCWGFGAFGQLGLGDFRSIGDNEPVSSVDPIDLGPGRTATAVSAGERHTCATLDDGSVRCWGYGTLGRLGYCSETTIGDDEPAASTGPVALGASEIAGVKCPSAPVAPPPPPPAGGGPVVETAVAPPPPAPAPGDNGMAAQAARAAAFNRCRRGVSRRLSGDRRRARALAPARRRAAVRQAVRRATRGRSACLRRHGRTPARVTGLSASDMPRPRTMRLTFSAVGTDGAKPPAARRYVVKQSTRPIRTARDFARAPSLCRPACTFEVTVVGTQLVLDVTNLQPGRRYHYAVAARDNVSGRNGRRSRAASATVR